MSTSAPSTDTCPACGDALPPEARFCPGCGLPTQAPGSTMRAEVPVAETGQVPVSYVNAEPRIFASAPPNLLLGVAAAVFVLAVVLFATGHWPFGLILLGLAALLFAAFLELGRRRPRSPMARFSSDARERAGTMLETWRARAAAAAEVRRMHSGLALLEAERRNALLRLGEAAHTHDETAEAGARAQLAELDAREADLRRELDERVAQAGERIRKARLAVQETMMVTPEPNAPYPPPGEATPPQPAVVPEPSPPPDEATPPTPASVPEPGPDTVRDPSE